MNMLRSLFFACLVIASTAVYAEKLNINTADADQIAAEMSGVGASRAQAIVDYRNQNGKFKSIEELSNVKGIGEATVDKNREKLSI
jgi:competence protein ComEA